MIAEEAHQEGHTRYSFGHFLPKVVRRVPQSHHSDSLSTLHKQTAVTLPEIEVHKLSREKHEKKTSRVNLPQNPEKERLRRCQVEKQVKKSGGQWWDWPERKRKTGMPNHSSFVKPGAEAVVGRSHCHGHNLPPLPHGVETVPTHIQPQAQRKLDPIKLGMPTFTHRVIHTLITTVMHAVFVSGYTNICVLTQVRISPIHMCPPPTHIGLGKIFLRSPSLLTLLASAITSPPLYTRPYHPTTFFHSHTKFYAPPSTILHLQHTQHTTAKCPPFHPCSQPCFPLVIRSYTTTPSFTSLPTAYTNHTITTLLGSSTHSMHLHL